MSETIVIEITGVKYRARRVGECLQLVGKNGPRDKWHPTAYRQGRYVKLTREVLGLTDPAVKACHHCDNPWCVEPSHLYAGTPAQNTADMMRRGRHGSRLLPEWKRNLYFELDQAYGPTLAAKYLGLKAANSVSGRRRTFFRS